MILFLHIPKTAGSTLRYIIKENYYDSFLTVNCHWTSWMSEKETLDKLGGINLDNTKIIYGHFGFGLHKHVHGSCRYITFLRNPTNRIISGYYHIKRDKSSSGHEVIHDLSFIEFVKSGLIKDFDNGQVRRLAGVNDTVEFGEINNEHLTLALNNIDRYFEFVGITEFFDESIVGLSEKLSWKKPFYWKQNVAKNKDVVTINEEDLLYVNSLNQYDHKLYEHFDQKLREFIMSKNRAFRNYMLKNRIYNLLLTPVKAIKKIQNKVSKM